MIMSFAAPLGVGLTSDAEYVDIALKTALPSAEAVARLNAHTVEGIEIVSFRQLPEDSKNAMSIVAAADYEVRFREGFAPEGEWQQRFLTFMEQKEIRILKETKRGSQEVDIRPWVYDYRIEDQVLYLQVSAGSVHNLKPELLIQAFADWAEIRLSPFALLIHRKECRRSLF